MYLLVVAIPVDYFISRRVCEFIENQEFNSQEILRDFLEKELGLSQEDQDANHPVFYTLSEFMDNCNDQYFDIEEYFISYVKITL
jgi:hypothetical protein